MPVALANPGPPELEKSVSTKGMSSTYTQASKTANRKAEIDAKTKNAPCGVMSGTIRGTGEMLLE
jgi:hypothetical protein